MTEQYSVLLSSYIRSKGQHTLNDSWQPTFRLGQGLEATDDGRTGTEGVSFPANGPVLPNCSKESRTPDFYMKCSNVSMLATNSKIVKTLCKPAQCEPNQTYLQACYGPPGWQFTNSRVGKALTTTRKHQGGHRVENKNKMPEGGTKKTEMETQSSRWLPRNRTPTQETGDLAWTGRKVPRNTTDCMLTMYLEHRPTTLGKGTSPPKLAAWYIRI